MSHRLALRFRLHRGAEHTDRSLRHAITHGPVLVTAILTALVVGSILTAINQGNLLLEGELPPALYWKVPLTYSVPCLVSTWSALRLSYVRRSDGPA